MNTPLAIRLKDVRLAMRMEAVLWYKCRNSVLAFSADLHLARAKLCRDQAKQLVQLVERQRLVQRSEQLAFALPSTSPRLNCDEDERVARPAGRRPGIY